MTRRSTSPALLVLGTAITAVLAMVMASSSATATSVVYLTDGEQAARSTAVVVAVVEGSTTSLHPQWGRPMTHTTVRVEEVLLGEAPSTLAIEQLGGEVAGRVMRVPGDAVFEVGERCVLFLRTRDGAWFLTALEQSKYKITASSKGALLHRPTTATEWVIDDEGALRRREASVDKPMKTLASFLATLAKIEGREP